jgi:hypothetical protein
LPSKKLQCTDDDPVCDFGVAAGDEQCTFHIAMCFNASETRFSCVPTDVQQVHLHVLQRTAVDAANRDALEGAMARLGGLPQQWCSRSGRCTWGVVFDPPLTPPQTCTSFADIVVPLRKTATGATGKGVRIIGFQTLPSRNPVTGRPRVKDSNFLKFTCQPHP